ncbi:MAG: sulfatase-like hydrolase/transferase [Acidobacteria bacterium]|nr:sulfatase-like hydrolase/transferase [Acidobacteriota bacterium]
MRRSIRATFATVGLALAALPAAATEAATSKADRRPPPPNLILVSSDDHRWDGLGAAGNPTIQTPHLDRLANVGVYYSQATVNVSQCVPVRASLLTGLAAHSHGAYSHFYRAPEAERPEAFADLPTLPSQLAAAGYETFLVGKWNLDSDPWRVGFQRIGTWLQGGGSEYLDPELSRGASREPVPVPGYTQEIFADEAVAFLESDAARARPFFLWLAFTAPHAPFGPNPERIQAFYRGIAPEELRPPGFPDDVDDNDWLQYAEAVSHLDEQLGRVLAALEASGLADSTVVAFLGDNGHMMGERGVGSRGAAGKVVPYEGSVRIPMILWAPGRQRAHGTSSLAVSSLDLPPTLLSLARVEAPASWPGRDLTPTLSDLAAPGFEEAYSEWADDRSDRFGRFAHRLVRTPTHKLVVWEDAARPDELYDLIADPHERTNLDGRPELEAIEADLRARLVRWLERTADPASGWPKLAASVAAARSGARPSPGAIP